MMVIQSPSQWEKRRSFNIKMGTKSCFLCFVNMQPREVNCGAIMLSIITNDVTNDNIELSSREEEHDLLMKEGSKMDVMKLHHLLNHSGLDKTKTTSNKL